MSYIFSEFIDLPVKNIGGNQCVGVFFIKPDIINKLN